MGTQDLPFLLATFRAVPEGLHTKTLREGEHCSCLYLAVPLRLGAAEGHPSLTGLVLVLGLAKSTGVITSVPLTRDLESTGGVFCLSQTQEHWQSLNMLFEMFSGLQSPCTCEEAHLAPCVCFWAGAVWLLSIPAFTPPGAPCSRWSVWPEILVSLG